MSTVLLGMLLILAVVGLAVTLAALNRERERQARLMQRMRKDSERQERAIVQLSERMNASMRQVNQLTTAMTRSTAPQKTAP